MTKQIALWHHFELLFGLIVNGPDVSGLLFFNQVVIPYELIKKNSIILPIRNTMVVSSQLSKEFNYSLKLLFHLLRVNDFCHVQNFQLSGVPIGLLTKFFTSTILLITARTV